MTLPNDPMMLVSAVNMKLRDQYPTLDELCLSEGVDKEDLCQRLAAVGYEYSETYKRFW